MSRKCDICGKGNQTGNNVSHSHLKTKKQWRPNVKKMRVTVNGTVTSKNVCSRCLRSGKINKPAIRATKKTTKSAVS